MTTALAEQSAPTAERVRDGTSQGRLPALDGLRGAAILFVLAHHFIPVPENGEHAVGVTANFMQIAHLGWIGVDLFFVLSGFLITGILLDSRESPHYFRNFYIRRTLRIFPLYYAALVALFVFLPVALRVASLHRIAERLLGSSLSQIEMVSRGQVWLWTYMANVKIALAGGRWAFVNHFWTLAVEEHFYLVWPLIVWGCSPRGLFRVCLMCIIGAPLLRAVLILSGADPLLPYVLTPCRVDSLAMGGLIALIARGPGGITAARRLTRWVDPISVVALAVLMIRFGTLNRAHALTSIFGYSILAGMFVSLLVELVDNPLGPLGRFFETGFLQTFGKYSYGIYLIHPFLQRPCKTIFPIAVLSRHLHSDLLGLLVHATLATTCAFVLAWLSWHLFEKRFIALKRWFPSGTGSGAEPIATSVFS